MSVPTKYHPNKHEDQPSPRLEVLVDVENDHDLAVKTAQEIEDRLVKLRKRYHDLSDM
jgi:hypothetical protein